MSMSTRNELLAAWRAQDVALMTALIARGVRVGVCDGVLCVVVGSMSKLEMDVVRMLLDAGTSEVGRDRAMRGVNRADVLRMLLDAGTSEVGRNNALWVRSGHVDLMRVLLDAGVSEDVRARVRASAAVGSSRQMKAEFDRDRVLVEGTV